MQARVFLLEADAGGLKPELPVTLVVEAHPELSFAGRIERVDALAKPRDPGVPVNYFEAVVLPDETRADVMKPGQRVRATIVLEELEDVITVPRQAVFDRDGSRVVYRARRGRLEPVEVTVGAHSLSRIIITEGLEPGDRVALRDPSGTPSEGGTGAENDANGPRVSGSRR
jgi:multidrug efflux pump subunit AcrA (membrane-fusion protein)